MTTENYPLIEFLGGPLDGEQKRVRTLEAVMFLEIEEVLADDTHVHVTHRYARMPQTRGGIVMYQHMGSNSEEDEQKTEQP